MDSLLETIDFYSQAFNEDFSGIEIPKLVWTKSETRPPHPSAYNPNNNYIFIDGGFVSDFIKAEEWNRATVAHEFSHFFMRKVIGRDDSPGALHYGYSVSDPALAFSEAFANSVGFTVSGSWGSYGIPTTTLRAWIEEHENIANYGAEEGCIAAQGKELHHVFD